MKPRIGWVILLLVGLQACDWLAGGRRLTVTYAPSMPGLFQGADELTLVYVFDYWGTKYHQVLRGESGDGDLYKNVLEPDANRVRRATLKHRDSVWTAEIRVPDDASLLSYYVTNGTQTDDNGRKTFVSYIRDASGNPVRGARFANVDFMLMAGKSYPEIVEELRKEIDAYPDHLLAHVVYWRFQYFDTASPDTLIILMNRAAEHFARLRDLPIARDSVLSFEAISYGDVDRVIWLSLIQQAKGKKVQKLIREMKQNIIRTVEAIPEGKRSPRVRGLYAAARDTSSLQYDLQAQQAAWEREYRQMTAEFVGKPAPDFPFRTIDGDRRRLSDFRGKLVLLDFWGSWCGPCVAEIPNLKVAYGKYASRGVVFISISNDAQASRWDVDDLRAFARKNGMSWTQVLDDSEGSLQKLYGIRFYPNMFLIGRDGTVLTRQGLRGDELQATLEKALGE